MRRLFFALGISVLAQGCLHVYVRDKDATVAQRKPDYTQRVTHWVSGFGTDFVNVSQACPSGNFEQLEFTRTFMDGLLHGLTIGVWDPSTANVWCRK